MYGNKDKERMVSVSNIMHHILMIRRKACSLVSTDEREKFLQSPLIGVPVDVSDAEQERPGLDECTLVLTLAVFILSSPKEVTCVPNLQAPVVEVFNQAWQSDSYQVSSTSSLAPP